MWDQTLKYLTCENNWIFISFYSSVFWQLFLIFDVDSVIKYIFCLADINHVRWLGLVIPVQPSGVKLQARGGLPLDSHGEVLEFFFLSLCMIDLWGPDYGHKILKIHYIPQKKSFMWVFCNFLWNYEHTFSPLDVSRGPLNRAKTSLPFIDYRTLFLHFICGSFYFEGWFSTIKSYRI